MWRHSIKVIAVLAAGIAAVPVAAADMAPKWQGLMTQYDKSDAGTYPIHLIRLGDSISVEYPQQKCSGTWSLIATHGDYKIYEERITVGRLTKYADEGCIDGIVTFRDGWKEAHLSWFAVFEGQPSFAQAVVRPVR
jgi:hypothetical protein